MLEHGRLRVQVAVLQDVEAAHEVEAALPLRGEAVAREVQPDVVELAQSRGRLFQHEGRNVDGMHQPRQRREVAGHAPPAAAQLESPVRLVEVRLGVLVEHLVQRRGVRPLVTQRRQGRRRRQLDGAGGDPRHVARVVVAVAVAAAVVVVVVAAEQVGSGQAAAGDAVAAGAIGREQSALPPHFNHPRVLGRPLTRVDGPQLAVRKEVLRRRAGDRVRSVDLRRRLLGVCLEDVVDRVKDDVDVVGPPAGDVVLVACARCQGRGGRGDLDPPRRRVVLAARVRAAVARVRVVVVVVPVALAPELGRVRPQRRRLGPELRRGRRAAS